MSSTSTCTLRRFTLAAMATLLTLAAPLGAVAAKLSAVPAQAGGGTSSSAFDGVVEAVRQTVVAAQVAGAVVQLDAKVGDRVAAGQVLMRLDARAAEQTAAASDAQVLAARAALDLASKDFDRQKQLYTDNYISKAALERAESEFKATQAQVSAQLAQSGAARTQSGLFVVKAPFAGVVSEVPVALGDMAMPGRPLLTLYDPAALRVTAAVPQTVAAQVTAQTSARTSSQVTSQKSALLPGQKSGPNPASQLLQIELPGLPGLTGGNQKITPTKVQLLPIVDAATHTVQVRAELPARLSGVMPGMFARLWLPIANNRNAGNGAPISVAAGAIVQRAELTGLYVLDPAGKPVLRQVRLGRVDGNEVEVLSGLMPGEQVVSDPQAAARVR